MDVTKIFKFNQFLRLILLIVQYLLFIDGVIVQYLLFIDGVIVQYLLFIDGVCFSYSKILKPRLSGGMDRACEMGIYENQQIHTKTGS